MWGGQKQNMSKCNLGDIHIISNIVKLQAQKSNDVSSNKELPISKCKTGKSSNMSLPHLSHMKIRIITELTARFYCGI